jgi:hypothetical protein
MLDRVHRAIAWQRVDQICCITKKFDYSSLSGDVCLSKTKSYGYNRQLESKDSRWAAIASSDILIYPQFIIVFLSHSTLNTFFSWKKCHSTEFNISVRWHDFDEINNMFNLSFTWSRCYIELIWKCSTDKFWCRNPVTKCIAIHSKRTQVHRRTQP